MTRGLPPVGADEVMAMARCISIEDNDVTIVIPGKGTVDGSPDRVVTADLNQVNHGASEETRITTAAVTVGRLLRPDYEKTSHRRWWPGSPPEQELGDGSTTRVVYESTLFKADERTGLIRAVKPTEDAPEPRWVALGAPRTAYQLGSEWLLPAARRDGRLLAPAIASVTPDGIIPDDLVLTALEDPKAVANWLGRFTVTVLSSSAVDRELVEIQGQRPSTRQSNNPGLSMVGLS